MKCDAGWRKRREPPRSVFYFYDPILLLYIYMYVLLRIVSIEVHDVLFSGWS